MQALPKEVEDGALDDDEDDAAASSSGDEEEGLEAATSATSLDASDLPLACLDLCQVL